MLFEPRLVFLWAGPCGVSSPSCDRIEDAALAVDPSLFPAHRTGGRTNGPGSSSGGGGAARPDQLMLRWAFPRRAPAKRHLQRTDGESPPILRGSAWSNEGPPAPRRCKRVQLISPHMPLWMPIARTAQPVPPCCRARSAREYRPYMRDRRKARRHAVVLPVSAGIQ